MKALYPYSIASQRFAVAFLVIAGFASCGAGGAEPAGASGPSSHGAAATVVPQESGAAVVLLAPEVQTSLDVQVAPVRLAPLGRVVRRAALVTPRPDRRSVVTVPVTGSIDALEAGFPALGDEILEGQLLLRVTPQLSVERDLLTGPQALDVDLKELDLRVRLGEAQGQLEAAKTALHAGDRELERARALVEASIVGSRRLDDAQTARDLAAVAMGTAERRVAQMQAEEARPGSGVEAAEPMEVRAPISGRLDTLAARPGQVIPAGFEVLSIVDDTHPWLSVQVYASERMDVDLDAEVAVFAGLTKEDVALGNAVPLHAPSPVAAAGGMVSRLYRLDSESKLFAPGERLFVDLPTADTRRAAVVPWSSVVFDAYGGVWVYLQEGPHAFRRRAVQFLRRDVDQAFVAEELGTELPVVVSGAYELFSIEFGGKH